MSWIESIIKKTVETAIKETIRPDFAKLEGEIGYVKTELIGLRERVSHLEGSVEGLARSQEANFRAYAAKMETYEARMQAKMETYEARMDTQKAEIRNMFIELRSDMLQHLYEKQLPKLQQGVG